MDAEIRKRTQLKLFITQFLLPQPIELLIYLFVSLLILLITTNRVLLQILSGSSPVPEAGISEVLSQRADSFDQLLAIPILGRVVLFLFWLAIGSVVYMLVWVFQNMAVEVYDDLTLAKITDPRARQAASEELQEESEDGGWWGTTLAHTIFVGSGVILFLFFLIIAVNGLLPLWSQLFQIGLQSIGQLASVLKIIMSLLGTMVMVHVFVLFWKFFFRLKGYVFNSF